MSFFIHGRFREQARFLRRQFLQDGDLLGDPICRPIAMAFELLRTR
jgi:hypothetical protein